MEYKKTLNMTKSGFPMRAGLPKREPEMLKRWQEQDVYHEMLKKNEGKPLFALHDGPPFSNGALHMGHALNKCIKDFMIRSAAMRGYYTPYIPGWDNHGMPIESAIIKEQKLNRKAMSVADFRTAGLTAAPVFAEQEAQLFGLDHAGGAARLAVAEQGVGDVAGHPFLVGEAVADGVHKTGDAAKAVQAAAGQVGDVGDAAEGHQVVRADAVDGDAAHHDHVAARVGEAVTECGRRVEVVAAEQAFLPKLTYAHGCFAHVRAVRGDAAGGEEVENGFLESACVKRLRARDAERGRHRCVVIAEIGHRGLSGRQRRWSGDHTLARAELLRIAGRGRHFSSGYCSQL